MKNASSSDVRTTCIKHFNAQFGTWNYGSMLTNDSLCRSPPVLLLVRQTLLVVWRTLFQVVHSSNVVAQCLCPLYPYQVCMVIHTNNDNYQKIITIWFDAFLKPNNPQWGYFWCKILWDQNKLFSSPSGIKITVFMGYQHQHVHTLCGRHAVNKYIFRCK